MCDVNEYISSRLYSETHTDISLLNSFSFYYGLNSLSDVKILRTPFYRVIYRSRSVSLLPPTLDSTVFRVQLLEKEF